MTIVGVWGKSGLNRLEKKIARKTGIGLCIGMRRKLNCRLGKRTDFRKFSYFCLSIPN